MLVDYGDSLGRRAPRNGPWLCPERSRRRSCRGTSRFGQLPCRAGCLLLCSILVYLSKCSPKKCYTEKMLYGEQVSGFNDPLYVGSCTIFYLQKVLFLFDTVGKKNTSSTWEAISRDFTSRCSSSHNSWKLEMAWHGFSQDLFPLPWCHFSLNHEEMGGRVYLDVPGS